MGTDERANGVAQTGDRAAAAALAVCFAAYLWLYLPIVPGFGSMYADDYGMHFPNLLAGYFHLLANGPLSVPWFNPAQCAGVPFLADLNVAFYSLPQLLTVFVDPANAVRATFVVAAALGAAGFHLLLRSRFAASPWAAATGAVLFLFNGFFVVRLAIGHLTFHPVMLTPWLAWAALLPATTASRWTWRRGVLATVLVGAVFAYQFQAGMQHIVVPLVLASGAGASARKSIGLTVFTGMIASTCLAVLFVPSLFVLIQRFEEWLQSRKKPKVAAPSSAG